jgi:hypothetical protein
MRCLCRRNRPGGGGESVKIEDSEECGGESVFERVSSSFGQERDELYLRDADFKKPLG